MIIEGSQIFSNNTAVAGNASGVVDLGKNGNFYQSNWVDVKLTAGGGSLTAVKLETSESESFAAPAQVASFYIPAALDQSRPATLAQFRLPGGVKRFVRLVYEGSGTVFAAIVTGVALS